VTVNTIFDTATGDDRNVKEKIIPDRINPDCLEKSKQVHAHSIDDRLVTGPFLINNSFKKWLLRKFKS
jgi:hypothetical protein